jgi:hypothetical protein
VLLWWSTGNPRTATQPTNHFNKMVKPKRTIKDHFKPITTQQNDSKNSNKPAATETRRTTRVTTSKSSPKPTTRRASPRTTTTKTSPQRTSIKALPKSSKTIENNQHKKNSTPSPHSSSSLSSLSSLDDNPTPTKGTTKTKATTIQTNKNDHQMETDDDDDDDDELPDHDFALPTTKRKAIQTKRQKPDPKTNAPHQKSPSPSSPSSGFNPARRRSSRLVTSTSKPSPSISIGSGSKTMIKLNKPAGPAKFSLEDILKDRRIRSEKQANLKRTREALGVSEDNELNPDELASNDPLLTPQKKSKTNNSHHDSKIVNGLDSICAQDPSTPPKAMMMLSDRTADLILSPSKAILLDEKDIDRFQSALATQSTAHKPKIHKILRDDLVSGKLSGLNRGLNYRQLFHPNLLDPESTANSAPPSLPRIDYCSLEGVSKDPEVIEFVQELIDNLECKLSLSRIKPRKKRGYVDREGEFRFDQTSRRVTDRPNASDSRVTNQWDIRRRVGDDDAPGDLRGAFPTVDQSRVPGAGREESSRADRGPARHTLRDAFSEQTA